MVYFITVTTHLEIFVSGAFSEFLNMVKASSQSFKNTSIDTLQPIVVCYSWILIVSICKRVFGIKSWFCNVVHLAPLTPAWPADLFGGGANINRKNVCKCIQSRSYNVCAIIILSWMRIRLALAQSASPRRSGQNKDWNMGSHSGQSKAILIGPSYIMVRHVNKTLRKHLTV